MKSGVIYGLKCKVTDKWYVGQSWNVKKRWWTYSKYECRNQPKLYNALVKYGIDAFEKSILEENITDQDTLDAREDYWTEKYDCVNNGYNCHIGRHGRRSTPLSAACLEKRRVDMTNSWKNPVVRQRILDGMRKTRNNRTEKLTPSAAAKQKLSKAFSSYWSNPHNKQYMVTRQRDERSRRCYLQIIDDIIAERNQCVDATVGTCQSISD